MNPLRQSNFRRNENLEELLKEINGLLAPVENALCQDNMKPQFPVILIVGSPRSGSTLLLQWLAQTGHFAYPTNFLSRFYSVPFVGAKIQRMLTDPKFNFRDEFFNISNQFDFKSSAGKTRGLLAPNEFWYFWRRFFPFDDIPFLNQKKILDSDLDGFTTEIALLQRALEKPFAMKGLIINWNIPLIYSLLNNVLFLNIERDPIFTAQSILKTREKYFGDKNVWYSFKPIEFDTISKSNPIEQVTAQVYFTRKSIHLGLDEISPDNYLTISYETFCSDPKSVFDEINNKMSILGYHKQLDYCGPKNFDIKNKTLISHQDFELLKNHHRTYAENKK